MRSAQMPQWQIVPTIRRMAINYDTWISNVKFMFRSFALFAFAMPLCLRCVFVTGFYYSHRTRHCARALWKVQNCNNHECTTETQSNATVGLGRDNWLIVLRIYEHVHVMCLQWGSVAVWLTLQCVTFQTHTVLIWYDFVCFQFQSFFLFSSFLFQKTSAM